MTYFDFFGAVRSIRYRTKRECYYAHMNEGIEMNKGALSARMIEEMMPGYISADQVDNINQASLDLALSDEAYRIGNVFMPKPGEKVRDILQHMDKWPHPMNQPMMRDQRYIVKVKGTIEMPEHRYAYANPKSSMGRTDTHVRLVADGVSRYDSIPAKWKGELWVLIQPKSFHIVVTEGLRVNQIRFFSDNTRFEEDQLEVALKNKHLLWMNGTPLFYEDIKITDKDGSVILLIDLESDIVGYKAIRSEVPLDLTKTKKNGADPSLYFEKIIRPECGSLTLEQGEFYILSSLEYVRVPLTLACEMVPMDDRAGEYRSHYAGYIDPGWGYGLEGEGNGRQLTLEVRPYERIAVRKRQPIAKIRFERMAEEAPSYDDGLSNYTDQVGPTLGKFWKKWE